MVGASKPMLAGGVEALDGAATTAGASEHVSTEGTLMKLGPVEALLTAARAVRSEKVIRPYLEALL